MNIKLILSSLLLMASLAIQAKRVEPFQGSRIFWDTSSEATIFSTGNYGRLIQLQDGRLMATAEASGIVIATSSNLGKTWSDPKKIVPYDSSNLMAVPDIIQLSDGTIIVGYNPRPNAPYSIDRKFGIRAVRSTDNGETWSDPIFIFDAQHTFDDGCWEPSFLELPSGELQVYFANESDYTSSSEQCISMCRSFDKGLTWSDPVMVSFRPNSRDGMPVPILLKDKSEIVVIIEDNGWAGRKNFTATTVRTSLASNWTEYYVGATSPMRNMIFKTTPSTDLISAAPYLRMLPWGETVASYQGNEGRQNDDLQWFDMFVEVGDENAKNFKSRSRPFALDLNQHAIWNSVAVIDTGIVCAIGSIGQPNKSNSIKMIKGYPKRAAFASYGHITVDGKKTSAEKWFTNNSEQLIMGSQIKKRSTFDFAYDEDYLYVTARVIERDLVNTTTSNDGVRLLLDAVDASSDRADVGLFNFFFDTNGTVSLKVGKLGGWREATTEELESVKYAINIQSVYYNLEAAIPWSLLGHEEAPVNQRMAVALEIFNQTESNEPTTETIPEVTNNASSTWLEMRLIPSEYNAINTPKAPADARRASAVRSGNTLTVVSSEAMNRLTLFSYQGMLVKDFFVKDTRVTLENIGMAHGVIKVEYSDGATRIVKF